MAGVKRARARASMGFVSVTGATVQRIDPRGWIDDASREKRPGKRASRETRDARHWFLDPLTVYSFLSLAQRKDWLALVAVHSDAWLMAVAFYYGAKFDAKKRYVSLWWFGGS